MSDTDGEDLFRPIVALQGAKSTTIQAFLARFAARVAADGFRVAGVVEIADGGPGGACGSLWLRDLSEDRRIAISSDLGPGSVSCNLDPGGVAEACARVEHAIARGADLIVLSKFGKLEAARGGLCDAFRAAIAAEVPIVTAVSPAMAEAWRAFAGDLATTMLVAPEPATGRCETGRLDSWWATSRRPLGRPGSPDEREPAAKIARAYATAIMTSDDLITA